jgi:hypothetical protein
MRKWPSSLQICSKLSFYYPNHDASHEFDSSSQEIYVVAKACYKYACADYVASDFLSMSNFFYSNTCGYGSIWVIGTIDETML